MDEAKRELVRSWLTKASRDLAAARLLATEPSSILDIALYHCQQAAEKSLKGYLAYCDRRLERTHDVGLLLERAGEIDPQFSRWQDAADRLTPLATAYRYPGVDDEPDYDEYEEAIEDAENIFQQVLSLLPGAVHPTR